MRNKIMNEELMYQKLKSFYSKVIDFLCSISSKYVVLKCLYAGIDIIKLEEPYFEIGHPLRYLMSYLLALIYSEMYYIRDILGIEIESRYRESKGKYIKRIIEINCEKWKECKDREIAEVKNIIDELRKDIERPSFVKAIGRLKTQKILKLIEYVEKNLV